MIQISQNGLRLPDETQLARWRDEFSERHCLILPQLIEPALAQRLWQQVERDPFERTIYQHPEGDRDYGIDMLIGPTAMALQMFLLLFNQSRLFEVVRQITGCPPIAGFGGRIYRIEPGTDQFLDWHEDTTGNYLVGLSVNLGPEPYGGGVFQIRERRSKRITREVAHQTPGDAHLFSIAPELQHRVTPLTGSCSRTAGSGWFCLDYQITHERRPIVNPVLIPGGCQKRMD
jgi:hypothetical protein